MSIVYPRADVHDRLLMADCWRRLNASVDRWAWPTPSDDAFSRIGELTHSSVLVPSQKNHLVLMLADEEADVPLPTIGALSPEDGDAAQTWLRELVAPVEPTASERRS